MTASTFSASDHSRVTPSTQPIPDATASGIGPVRQQPLHEGDVAGLRGAQDYAEAAVWFRKAAGQMDGPAQYNLGVLYANGQGVSKDATEAAAWFRKSADQEYGPAQLNLAVLYVLGQGVPRDYPQAVEW